MTMSIGNAREVAQELFSRIGNGASPDMIAALFDEDVDWYIAGDAEAVPWIGRKIGRTAIAEFYHQLREHLASERFSIAEILGHGDSAVALGSLATRVKTTGALIETEFASSFRTRDGLVIRYRMFEDSYAVASAYGGWHQDLGAHARRAVTSSRGQVAGSGDRHGSSSEPSRRRSELPRQDWVTH